MICLVSIEKWKRYIPHVTRKQGLSGNDDKIMTMPGESEVMQNRFKERGESPAIISADEHVGSSADMGRAIMMGIFQGEL